MPTNEQEDAMQKYEVVIVEGAIEIKRKTVEAKSFEDALKGVVPDAKEYALMHPIEEKVRFYQSQEYIARVSLV
jgi:hypothetical protein